jgi:hypothetical protein
MPLLAHAGEAREGGIEVVALLSPRERSAASPEKSF